MRRASASVSAAMLWAKDSRDAADCRDGDETRGTRPPTTRWTRRPAIPRTRRSARAPRSSATGHGPRRTLTPCRGASPRPSRSPRQAASLRVPPVRAGLPLRASRPSPAIHRARTRRLSTADGRAHRRGGRRARPRLSSALPSPRSERDVARASRGAAGVGASARRRARARAGVGAGGGSRKHRRAARPSPRRSSAPNSRVRSRTRASTMTTTSGSSATARSATLVSTTSRARSDPALRRAPHPSPRISRLARRSDRRA